MGNEADRDVAIDRATLKMLVCQQLTCANTGAILDQRSAVALEVKVGEKTQYFGPYALASQERQSRLPRQSVATKRLHRKEFVVGAGCCS